MPCLCQSRRVSGDLSQARGESRGREKGPGPVGGGSRQLQLAPSCFSVAPSSDLEPEIPGVWWNDMSVRE